MPLLGVELEPVLVSFGRFYDIFVIFLTMRLFGGATYFCHLSWGATFCHLFGGATFLSSLILYGDFCHLLRRRHFCHLLSYIRGRV